MKVIKPPGPTDCDVFLAGSIEMGKAPLWRAKVELALADLPLVIANPRRDDWDSSWGQSIDHPDFRAQVEWELMAMASAWLVPIYFAPGTKSPITLMELGLLVHSGYPLVCCPSGFWRKGNVEVVCQWFGIPFFEDFGAFLVAVRSAVPTSR